MFLSFPVALVFGIRGIIHDEHKLLAIITSIIAGGLVACYVMAMLGTGLALC